MSEIAVFLSTTIKFGLLGWINSDHQTLTFSSDLKKKGKYFETCSCRAHQYPQGENQHKCPEYQVQINPGILEIFYLIPDHPNQLSSGRTESHFDLFFLWNEI